MIEIETDREHAILTVRPKGPLTERDFKQAAAMADPIIGEQGKLNGLIIQASKFPGWESFTGALSHFRFVRDHHKHIRRVAVVSDDTLLKVAPHISSHFVTAKIRHFPAGKYEQAKAWIVEGTEQDKPSS